MDITLIPGKTRTMLEYIQCFNPCFNGYYTYTIGELKIGYSKILVSILVLMDITLILVQSQTIAITHIQQY